MERERERDLNRCHLGEVRTKFHHARGKKEELVPLDVGVEQNERTMPCKSWLEPVAFHGKYAAQLYAPWEGVISSIYACRVRLFIPCLRGSGGGGGAELVWIAPGWVSRDSRKPTASLSLSLSLL